MLKSIPKSDVQKICSGQSVVDLATAVKELVENALDAGATIIEVKLKEFGQLGFEVSDNGNGIAENDYETIALKHYTSKISAFEDLESVKSFGFRGEALSSICQLARTFSVITRTKDDSIGTHLQYDNLGVIISSTKKARAIGTTVIVEDLFQPLPVRHKDFVKNIKRHYGKTLRTLQGYAVISSNVKISCINFTGKNNSRQEVLSTQINQSIADNIANVFGSKFLKSLLPVDITLPLGDEITGNAVGYISKVGAGVGRSDNDRQFFYVNGRPVDLLTVTKAVNEVWRQYEMKQKPACIINFILPTSVVDVNVTPDKRETFIRDEMLIVECLKEGLNVMYEPSRGTFQVQSILPSSSQSQSEVLIQDVVPDRKRKLTDTSIVSVTSTSHTDMERKPKKIISSTSPSLLESDTESDADNILPVLDKCPPTLVQQTHTEMATIADDEGDLCTSLPKNVVNRQNFEIMNSANDSIASPIHTSKEGATFEKKTPQKIPYVNQEDSSQPFENYQILSTPIPVAQSKPVLSASKKEPPRRWVSSISKSTMKDLLHQRKIFFNQKQVNKEAHASTSRKEVPIACAIETCDDAEEATASLQRILSKDDFRRMEVIGQFNLGFIIAKLDDDLFIIDQHASDEKFRYETLQQTTVIHQQPLVCPMALEVTAVEEMTILDHLDIFKKQGFQFQVELDAPVGKKLKLISLPFSKHTQWGVDDVRELVSLLLETPNPPSNLRLPKTLAMFASRACRSAIMIGTALKKEDMQKAIDLSI